MNDILSQIRALLKEFTGYFNSIGRFYLKYQLFFRVLFVNVLLSDIFGGEKLICDTGQPGCQEMCVNRFAPITFKKVWELELWMVLIVDGIFILFVYANKRVLDKKKYEKIRKRLRVEEKQVKGDKVIIYSALTAFGYVVMLIIRLMMEIYFLRVEYQLAVHQSGKTGIQAFSLPEKYHCLTHIGEEFGDIEVSGTKDSARSDIFYFSEPLLACSQSRIEVPCWIPISHMKTKGLYFMYGVLIISTCLTFLELVMVMLNKVCKRNSNKALNGCLNDASNYHTQRSMVSNVSNGNINGNLHQRFDQNIPILGNDKQDYVKLLPDNSGTTEWF